MQKKVLQMYKEAHIMFIHLKDSPMKSVFCVRYYQ